MFLKEYIFISFLPKPDFFNTPTVTYFYSSRVIRSALIHDNGGPVDQWTIDNVAMPRYPARIGRAPPTVLFLNIKNIFMSGGGINTLATVSVQNTFGTAGGP
jgi:hypothetical protein